jgi:rRNA processing protein Krr1/Pno1
MMTNDDREYKEPDHAALQEARSIIHAMKHGVDMSDVFTITQKEQSYLNALAHSEYAYIGKNAMAYRAKVQAHVDRLIKEGDVVVAEAEEAEADVSESAEDTEAVGSFSIQEELTSAKEEASEVFDSYEW